MMEVTWTKKIDDKGPQFKVVNKTKLEVLYGFLVVYFYDKAGKQLPVAGLPDAAKPRLRQVCGGNIFAGEVLLAVLAFIVPYLVSIPFFGLELFVGLMQAFVFAMLTLVFMTMATMGHGSESEEH